MTNEIAPLTTRVPDASGQLLTVHAPGVSMDLPDLIGRAGEAAAFRTLEFFTSCTPNPHTRGVYSQAVRDFCAFGAGLGAELEALASPTVAAWVQTQIAEGKSPATVNVRLSGVRQWLEWLARHGAITGNPADTVKGIKLVVREGKTPIVELDEARRLLESLGAADVVALRDRAMIAVMLLGGVRISAVVRMKVGDFEDGARPTLKLREKGGKERRIACHHVTREYLDAYLTAAGLAGAWDAPLFPGAPGHAGQLTGAAMTRQAAWYMVKRRAKGAGLPRYLTNHSFRAMCATFALENGAPLEGVQELLGHADPGTTQRYNRKARELSRSTVECVQVF
jgi:integrase/recombinase XerD